MTTPRHEVGGAAVGARPGSRALRLAHRGDWRRAPENTIPAFLAALAIPGCDGLEFDVRAARGGVPVCYHDDTLTRVHGIDARVDTLSADELEELGVPTLERALTTIPRRPFLDIELKGDLGRAAFEAIVAGRGPGLERAVVSSFEPAALERIAGYAPRWPRWLNTLDASRATLFAAVELGCRGVSVEWHALDRGVVQAATAAGLEVAAWTVRRRPTFDRLHRLGIRAVCVEAKALDGWPPGDPRANRPA
jgi:glycerophosphoryl diester phosphodiesterase